MQYPKGTFGYDVQFLQKYKPVICLKNEREQAQLLIVGDYQARVMTSTANGNKGRSYGWINYDLIRSGVIQKHINPYGGEDRFWLGPEGSQYAIFFPPNTAMSYQNWQTPASIDTEPFILKKQTTTNAIFQKSISLQNYAGTNFNVNIERNIQLFDKNSIEKHLSVDLDRAIQFVGFESVNVMKNESVQGWTYDKGVLCIWILGMFKANDATTVVIPTVNGKRENINTAYFKALDMDRLQFKEQTVFYRGDGHYRSKIGIPPKYAVDTIGSYDAQSKVLTIVQYSLQQKATYVNALWQVNDSPYNGDVINAYNDGPEEAAESDVQLGAFYELETSSPAKALAQNESLVHIHRTFHFEGEKKALNQLSRQLLGLPIATIESVF